MTSYRLYRIVVTRYSGACDEIQLNGSDSEMRQAVTHLKREPATSRVLVFVGDVSILDTDHYPEAEA